MLTISPFTYNSILNYYFFFLKVLIFFIKTSRLVWFFPKKKWRSVRIFFLSWPLQKKKIKVNFLSRRFNKNQKLFLSQRSLLFLKRRFGALKYRYDPKAYNLYRIDNWINLKRKKFKRRLFFFRSLKYKHFNKFFFKKVRKYIYPITISAYTRQLKKSRYIYSFFKKKRNLYLNISIVNLLISLQLFLTYSDAITYIKQYGFYKNNTHTNNINTTITLNDTFSLNNSFIHYSYVLYGLKKFRRFFKKVKPRIFKMMRNKIDLNKQATRLFPKWTVKLMFYKNIRPDFIEYDISTLNFICFKKPSGYSFFLKNENISQSFYLSRLYNWKYIN